MLPNHSPLVIAEQFGTLESLYPGRIDLGLGRAPGTDQLTAARAAPRPDERERVPAGRAGAAVPASRPAQPGQAIRAVPGAGLEVPLWILGSSLFGAQLAAALGLPYAFASHFAPTRPAGGARRLPERVPPVARSSPEPVRDGRRQRRRRRHRRGGAAALHDAAAVVGEPLPRPAGPVPAADRRHRGVLDAGREGAGVGDARRTRSSARRRPCATASSSSSS